MKRLAIASLAVIGFTLMAAQPANAAFVFICDSDECGSPEGSITFNLNDFEGTFQVNGAVVQSGLGNPTHVAVQEGAPASANPAEIDFSGVWILGGPIFPLNETIFFTESGGGISDVLHFTYTQDSIGNGHLDGFVMSDVSEAGGIDPAFLSGLGIVATGTASEESVLDFSNTNITAQFQSDPEPATLALLGLGLAGLGFSRRRKLN